jgi:hypothetical protein
MTVTIVTSSTTVIITIITESDISTGNAHKHLQASLQKGQEIATAIHLVFLQFISCVLHVDLQHFGSSFTKANSLKTNSRH